MAETGPLDAPRPGFMTRLFFRVPPYMYRAHLGWMFGHRVVYLVHVGRKTGKTRRTCIEVIKYDKERGESTVISAFGRKADWFRNISNSPPLELRLGRERFVPEFRILPVEEAQRTLREFFAENPGEAKFFLKRFFHLAPTEEKFEGLAKLLPLVAFRPRFGQALRTSPTGPATR